MVPVLFFIYTNDMVEGDNNCTRLFEDDPKVVRRVRAKEDHKALQEDLNRIYERSQEWEMKSNI